MLLSVLSKTAYAIVIEIPPAQLLGSDISIGRKIENTLCSEYLDQPNTLYQSNEINRYTLVAKNKILIVFRTFGSLDPGLREQAVPLGVHPSVSLPGSLRNLGFDRNTKHILFK